jgi:3-oxoacyl-[acyl-carrier protein] reductase
MTLQNKTALVTGASRGIGRATAAALAQAGAHVLVHYGRSAQEAESLVAEIRTKGGRADAISADLGTPEGAALLTKQCAPLSAIDWMCWCSMQESARRQLSPATR